MAMEAEPKGDPILEQQDRGSAWVVSGLLLFIFDLIVFAFVPRAVRDGTHFMVIMFFTVALLALAAVIRGYQVRVAARNTEM